MLMKLAKKVIRVGEIVVKIGQKVLELVIKFVSRYPNTTFGAVFGAIAGYLVSSIPIIGFVLGPLVSPILLLVGVVYGAKSDLIDLAIEGRIKSSLGSGLIEFQSQ